MDSLDLILDPRNPLEGDASNRTRALTPPLEQPARIALPRRKILWRPQKILWREQKTTQQRKSLLFTKLPPEVRQQIYTYALVFPYQPILPYQPKPHFGNGRADIHIYTLDEKQLIHRRCCAAEGYCTRPCLRNNHTRPEKRPPVKQWGSLNLLALLLTCRQM